MSSEQSPELFLSAFSDGITNVQEQSKDSFHNQLYFSNVISLMEQYLSNLFIYEVKNERRSLQKLADHDKFKSAKISVPFALNNSIETYLVTSMKSLVWHRLNDVEMYYKKVLDISFNISRELLSQLELRHDLIHRTGYKLDGSIVNITEEKLNRCITLVEVFINDIHSKYLAAKS